MIVQSAKIKNYRCLKEVTVNFEKQTVLVGSNGAGKSSVLRAIELFYLSSISHIKPTDFYDTHASIDIELTFTEFSDAERELFGSRIVNNQMTVARIIEMNGGRNNGRYFGVALVNPEFKPIKSLEGKPKKEAFNAIPREGKYADLATVTRIDDIEEAMKSW